MPQGKQQSASLSTKSLNLRAIRPWINNQLFQILGFDDEILQNLIVAHLETNEFLDPKALQSTLLGFLGEKQAHSLVTALCNLIQEAEQNPQFAGIPPSLLSLPKNKK